jgi:trigger factor
VQWRYSGSDAGSPSLPVQCRGAITLQGEGGPIRATPGRVWSNGSVAAQVEELGDDRVRLTVDVPSHDVQHAVEHAASDLAQSLRIPGFRKGKVPMPVLLSRVGRDRLMTEAVESHIGGWFWTAAAERRLRPVAQPEYDFELPESEREDWRFTATVAVQPKPDVADWKGLEVPRPHTDVPADLVDHELELLRSVAADLAPVEGRPAQEGDTVVLDLASASGDTQRDYVAELGQGRLIEEIEHGVVGMSPGETKEIDWRLGDDAVGSVTVALKEIREKVLPPLDDELARAGSEFETLDELRADIEAELREQLEAEAESVFRTAVADALVDASRVEAAGPLVDARTRDLVNGLVRSVEARGIGFETYLGFTGATPEEFVERMRSQASRAVARELVLEAVADRLDIEVSDEQVEEVVREQAAAIGDDPEAAIVALRERGGWEQLREDLRMRDALDRVAAEVTPISTELAAAREAIWTPEKEKPETETKLWTPGEARSIG